METDLVRAATYIHAPFDAVWTALTRPDRHADWYVAPCLAFGWERGEAVAWGTAEKPVIEGRLLEWEPATHLAYTFAFASLDEPGSVVEWDVQPSGEVVWVEVRHHFPDDAPATLAIVTDGWTLVLARLKTLLETQRPMPWPDEEEAEEVGG